jgi:pimeloyl-ACP methyl ester carboxylesterase
MTNAKSGYAPVNGLQMYYEVHGEGEPLILLHGGLGRQRCSALICRCLPNRDR